MLNQHCNFLLLSCFLTYDDDINFKIYLQSVPPNRKKLKEEQKKKLNDFEYLKKEKSSFGKIKSIIITY